MKGCKEDYEIIGLFDTPEEANDYELETVIKNAETIMSQTKE